MTPIDEQEPIARSDCGGSQKPARQSDHRHLVSREPSTNCQPAAVHGRGPGDFSSQPVSNLSVPVLLHPRPELGDCRSPVAHRATSPLARRRDCFDRLRIVWNRFIREFINRIAAHDAIGVGELIAIKRFSPGCPGFEKLPERWIKLDSSGPKWAGKASRA